MTTYFYGMSLVIILFFLLGYLLINDEVNKFHKESVETRSRAIESQKALIKNRVEKVVDYIHYKKSLAEERLREEVKNRTYEAHQMATFIYEQNSGKPLAEIKTLIHDALYAVSWDRNKGYYFAEDMNGTEMVNRNNPDLEGVNILNLQDSNGTYLVREIIAVAGSEKGEGFCSYYWNKPGHPKVLVPKISYVKYFRPLDWVIGTGKYLEDEKKAIKEETLARIKEINKTTGTSLLVGTWQGRDLLDSTNKSPAIPASDQANTNTIKKLIATARSGGGFISDSRPTSKNKPAIAKVSYSQAIADWHWYIGAVIDLRGIEKSIEISLSALKEDIRKKIIQIALAFFFLLICTYFISRRLTDKIKKDITLFDNFFTATATQTTKLNQEKISFIEFNKLAVSANTMIEKRLKTEQALQESKIRATREKSRTPAGENPSA